MFHARILAGYQLELNKGNTQDFHVIFHGPKGTAYESGVWKVHVTLPDDYPFVSPSIGFVNKILHPNIDEASGSVCLDVINQTWTPLYTDSGLVNVFEIFLPQLLTYPNPTDPLNVEAGGLYMRNKDLFEQKIREYVQLHANGEGLKFKCQTIGSRSSSSRLREEQTKLSDYDLSDNENGTGDLDDDF